MTDKQRASLRANLIVAAIVLAIVGFMTWWILMEWSAEPSHTVHSGDRVCVAMLDADGNVVPKSYYCGPVVFTTHDGFAGEDRP